MDLKSALKEMAGSFSVSPGDVCLVEDESVAIPETPDDKRTYHENGRPCVVLQNGALCTRPTYPIVLIAPISHRVDLKDSSDFELKPCSRISRR